MILCVAYLCISYCTAFTFYVSRRILVRFRLLSDNLLGKGPIQLTVRSVCKVYICNFG